MSLADRLATAPVVRKSCGVVDLLATLPEADREALATALNDPAWNGEAIGRALRAEGHTISGSIVQRHRRGTCSCGARDVAV